MSLLRGVDQDSRVVRVDRRRSSARHQCAVLYFLFFVMGTEGFLMPPILPALAADLDISIALAAATSTAFVVTYAVFGPPLGVLSDIRPKRQPVLAGMALFAISNIGVGLAQNFPQMLLARTLMGFAAAVALPAAWAHLSDICPPPRRGRAITNGFAVYGFGQVVGVPLGAFATQVFGWRLPYLAIGVGFVAVLGWAVRTIDTRAPRETAVRWSNMVRPLAVPVVCLALAATFAVQAGRLGAFTYVGALLESRFGFDVAARGLVGALVGVTVIVGSLLSGSLVDRQRRGGHHEGWITVVGALFFAAAVALAASTTTLWIFVVALTMWCLAGGLSYSAQQAYLADVRPAARTTVVAWHSTVMNVGHAAGNTALGSVAIGGTAFAAIAAGFGVLGAVLAVAVVLTHRLRRPGDR